MESSSIEIKLSRTDSIYRPGDVCEGIVTINVYKGWSHNGVLLLAEGYIQTVVPKMGYAVTSEDEDKSIILSQPQELKPKGNFNEGVVEIPFKFTVSKDRFSNNDILESYHGVYVSVIYHILVTIDRGMMKKSLKKDKEFVIEIGQHAAEEGQGVSFDISPSKLVNVDPRVLRTLPNFSITGKVHRTNCNINQPFTGEVRVDMSVATIKSLELQLVRVESVDSKGSGQFFKEATEIQLLQIGEGNICRGLVVPMYMVFPRLFSCPTVRTSRFKIEFEINLLVVLGDGHLITENFPIEISRSDTVAA